MDVSRVSWPPVISRLGCGAQCATLAGATLVVLAGVAIIEYCYRGLDGLLAVALPAAICLAGSEGSLVSTRLARKSSGDGFLRGMLFGMSFRLAVPLTGAIFIRLFAPELVAAGALYYLILFYLVTLAIEIGFELSNLSASHR